ncbi:MAG TPA: hypothetical protein VGC41_05270, partial [Kofleriaceae bacterium]
MSRVFCVVCVCVLAGVAAAEPTIAFEYKAPDDCPKLAAVRSDVDGRLGRDPFFNEAPRRAIVEVWHTARGYFAQFDLVEAGHETTHQTLGPFDGCIATSPAIASAIVDIVDPMHTAASGLHPIANDGGRSGNSMTVRVEQLVPPDYYGEVRAGVLGGVYPTTAFGIAVHGGLEFEHSTAGLWARYGQSLIANEDGYSASSLGGEIGVDACARWLPFVVCGQVGAGIGRSSLDGHDGFGVVHDTSGYFLVGGTVGFEFPVTERV